MKKEQLLAAALAAICAFTFAPAFDTGIAEMDLSRPAFARAKDAANRDASLHSLPLVTGTHYLSDWDGPFEMLRSHWTDIRFYGSAKAPEQKVAQALAGFSRMKSDDFGRTRKLMLADSKADWSQRIKDGSPYYGPYWFTGDILVRRSDSAAVSFLEDKGIYAGGTHGGSELAAKNYDARTGQELQLSDVFVNKHTLAEAIKKRLKEDYPDASFMEDGGAAAEEAVDRMIKEDSMVWTLEPHGVTFWFNPYRLGGTYAEEMFVTTLFYLESPELFKRNKGTDAFAWRALERYCMDVRLYTAVRLSGKPGEKLTVGRDNDGIQIEFRGEEYRNELELRNTDIRPTLVNCSDGRKYLYVDYEEPASRYSALCYKLYVYDLNGASPRFVGVYPMTRLASPLKDTAKRSWYVMSDPEDFYMTATMDSNLVPGKRLRCRVGEDGAPEVLEVEGAKG